MSYNSPRPNAGSRDAVQPQDRAHHRVWNGHSRVTALAVVTQRDDDEAVGWDYRKYLPADSLLRVAVLVFVFLVFLVLAFRVVLVFLTFEKQVEVERIFAMRVDHVLLPEAVREVDRVRVVQIVANLNPEIPLSAAVAERVGVDDTAVNGFDVNFVSHVRQSSIQRSTR